jgi:signal transduction histidine kinase/DNA-binding response OmpR family regulator
MQSPRAVALILIAAGALPPIGLAALPGGLSMLGAPSTGIVLVTALLFAPALAGFAVALQGFDAVVARLRAEAPGEYRQIVARVLLGALIFAYVFGLLAARPGDNATGLALLIGSLNLAAAWLFLLNLVLEPRRSALRHYAALVSDVTLLSVLLAAGDGLTAPLAVVYPYIAISNAEHYGPRALVLAVALEIVAFAATAAVTPFWRAAPLLAGVLLAAMIMLPAYVGAVLHGLGAAKLGAEAANGAKNRFLTALSEDLRGPLRTISRAGAALDRSATDPELWDIFAKMRLSARAMLLQLDDMLNYVKIDGGTFAPETRSFDLYRLANGVVQALRAAAAERGIVLALRIDPQLPYQLRGWPHQLRQILICLITNAVRQSGKAKVRINFDAIERDTDRVTLRVTVASGLADSGLETLDEELGDASRHLGLGVADRLVGLMGGRTAADTDSGRGLSLIVELPFAIDRTALALPLDLAHLPVLIVTKDADFVGDLIEPLESWRADPRWIGAGDAALAYLAAFDAGLRRPVLVVDGRGDVLQALSWTHRATRLRAPEPPLLLFIADELRIDSVVGLADGELDGILPAPFTADALRSALHALRVEPADWFLADVPVAAATQSATAPPRHRVDEEAPPPRSPAAEEPPPHPSGEPIRIVPPRPAPTGSWVGLPPQRRRQILVAATNPANRKILGSILERAGHIVHFAEDVDEARQGLEAREVDALVLDLIGYAGADYAAARHCRRARPTLPIIALSGDSADLAERRAREVGLDAVLPKPIEPRRLLAALAAAFDPEPSAEAVPPGATAGPRGVVTELASHPRFFGEAASSPAERPAASPWSANPEGEPFQALIDSFRIDSMRLVVDLDQAAGSGDVPAFNDAIQAMRACTEIFGVGRVRDLLDSMREPTPAKLRLQGADFIRRLESELARLDGALADYLKTAK